MKHGRTTSPEEKSPSESTSPPSAEGVEFVRGEDYDYALDCLIRGGKQAIAALRAKGLLPEQQEQKPKGE